MQRITGRSSFGDTSIEWLRWEDSVDPTPVSWLSKADKAAELGDIEAQRARLAAREAELVVGLAGDCPAHADPPEGAPGARSRSWRAGESEFDGVSEFFPDELAHALNLGRGTASFRARRAYTFTEKLPRTLAALAGGVVDERRAGVLADVAQNVSAELAGKVEDALLDEAAELSPTRLKARALELLAELDADAMAERQVEAKKAAQVWVEPAADGMASLGADLPAEEAAEAYDLIDQIARMAKTDGDTRPIGAIRAEVFSLLLRRPAGHGLPTPQAKVTITAALESLEGSSSAPGEVNGFVITIGQLRNLLARVGALGLDTPPDGSLTFAVTDPDGRLLATLTPAELARLARRGCPHHPDPGSGAGTGGSADADAMDRAGGSAGGGGTGGSPGDCGCPVAGLPEDSPGYTPTAAQRRAVTCRDRRCRMPNCGQRAGWADLDHVVPHADGGVTGCANLCCLCRSHHRLKTFAPGWTFRMDPDGTLHVTSPAGITRTTRPLGLRKKTPAPPEPAPTPDPPPF